MKKLGLILAGLLLVVGIVGCTQPEQAHGDDGRINVVATSGVPEDYHYTIVHIPETGCTVLITEDSWNGAIAQSTLTCDTKVAE